MNIAIANQYNSIIKNLGIPLQEYDGLYEVNQLGQSLHNRQYDNLIVDVTALKNYQIVSTIKQLTNYIDPNKLLLLLDNNCVNDEYLSGLVSAGIYNFAKDLNGLVYLLTNRNQYSDVAGFQQNDKNISEYSSDSLTQEDNVLHCKVIGIENVTRHAGATTLAYTLVKNAKKKYNVIGIEVDSTDFAFFRSKDVISTIGNKIKYMVNQNSDKDLIVIDVNGSDKAREVCDEILYLVEPTTIKINKLILEKPNVFQDLFDKKIVLNKCFLNKWDVAEFENEIRIKTFYRMPFINEREKNDENVVKLLDKLGFKI